MMIPIVVQNADVVAKRSDYSWLLADELLVHGHFYTIQGEGPWGGLPTHFFRLAGCNYGDKTLFCKGCDSSFHLKDGTILTFKDMLDSAKGMPIVITGGEPCLQPNLPSFVDYAVKRGAQVQIETNGSQLSNMLKCAVNGAVVVCSPKASNKGYSTKTSITSKHVNCLKFVVSSNPDDPHHTVPAWAKTVGVPIYVSPFTVYAKAYSGEVSSIWEPDLIDHAATRENYKHAAKLALDNGYRVSVQMHTFLDLA